MSCRWAHRSGVETADEGLQMGVHRTYSLVLVAVTLSERGKVEFAFLNDHWSSVTCSASDVAKAISCR